MSLDDIINSKNKSRGGAYSNTVAKPNVKRARIKGEETFSRTFQFGDRPQRLQPVPTCISQSINISNLAPSVSDSDIIQLFSEFGELIKPSVHYDAQGCHLGSATVTFARVSEARRAIVKYNGVSLDRYPMKIQLNQPENTHLNITQGPSTSMAMRLSHTNNINGMKLCSSNESSQRYEQRNRNLVNIQREFIEDSQKQVKRRNYLQGDSQKRKADPNQLDKELDAYRHFTKQKRKADPDKLDKELDAYMGTTQRCKSETKKQEKELSLPNNGLTKFDSAKKRRITSILQPDESSPSPVELDINVKDQIKQEDLDKELDEFIAQQINIPSISTEEHAEKIQKKLLTFI